MHPTANKPAPTNFLYYGDNLNVMRLHLKPESIDLVYLDPPFNSKQDYNAFFEQKDGAKAAAQIKAFEDTWHWDAGAQAAFDEALQGDAMVANAMIALRKLLGTSDMMAYLAMMAPRLVALKRAMKPNASIYLHCDPTAGHYLKALMDAIFGPENFRNEIVWKRTFAHGNVSRNYGSIADLLFYYTTGPDYTWNQQYRKLTPAELDEKYPNVDPDGRRWQSVTLRNPGKRPNLHYVYTASNGVPYKPHPNGWSCDETRMKKYDREGLLHFPKKPDGALRLRMYEDKSLGERLQNIWDDIPPIAANAAERLGYPTQKPEALLERIVRTSSNEGDVVLDPFCGCGTAVVVAERLKRNWIGIDITYVAVALMKNRLETAFEGKAHYKVLGEPETLEDARKLAAEDKYQFQWWALDLVGARPKDQKKGADGGVDGRLYFKPEGDAGSVASAIISVKGGENVGVKEVRDLWGTVEQEGAKLGVMLMMEEPTRPMREAAASAGFYKTAWGKFPALQILTVKQLLGGIKIDMPQTLGVNVTLKAAPKAGRASRTKQGNFLDKPAQSDAGQAEED